MSALILTDERKAAIRDHVRTYRVDDPAELKAVLIDPDVPEQFLTNEMIREIMSAVKAPKTEIGSSNKRHYKRAIRVSRSPETWRHLEHYPAYQISSHGRLRSAMRANETDVLKPRFSWHYGKLVAGYNIIDKDGIRRCRFMGTLMINAGFVKARNWKKGKSETAV